MHVISILITKTYNAYTLVYIGRYIKKLLIMVRLKQVYNTVQSYCIYSNVNVITLVLVFRI